MSGITSLLFRRIVKLSVTSPYNMISLEYSFLVVLILMI